MPVTTTWSIHSLTGSRVSVGRMPMVVPPALLAPRAAAAITSPSPPVTTVAPRSARSRPTCSAFSSCSLPLPTTETWTAISAMLGHMSAAREARGGVLVVGGGFAGAYVAKELGHRGATIVSKENFMLYTPLLPEAASGTLEPRHCVVPLREMCPHAELILGSVTTLDLEAKTAAVELRKRGIESHVEMTLESVTADSAVLGDGTRIPTSMLVWTAGVAPNPVLREWSLPLDEKGRVEVDELLRVRGHEHVWALGDCALVPNARSDRPDPPTSQHALRQARRLARNLTGPPEPYGYRMLGQVATLGRHKGIAEVLGLRLHGFLGWWVTRSYHLYQLPLAPRKARVVVDWTVALFFRRDIAELGRLGHPEKLG